MASVPHQVQSNWVVNFYALEVHSGLIHQNSAINFTNFERECWNGIKGGLFPNYPEFFEDPESLFWFTLQGILVFVPWTVLDPITDLIVGATGHTRLRSSNEKGRAGEVWTFSVFWTSFFWLFALFSSQDFREESMIRFPLSESKRFWNHPKCIIKLQNHDNQNFFHRMMTEPQCS